MLTDPGPFTTSVMVWLQLTLEQARERLMEAVDRLMRGDETAQSDFDRWDKFISNHPEHLAQVSNQHAARQVQRHGHGSEGCRCGSRWRRRGRRG